MSKDRAVFTRFSSEFDIGIGINEGATKKYLYVQPDSTNRVKFTIRQATTLPKQSLKEEK